MKDEPRLPSKHQLDHALPTVIHNPEEDMPLLARWVYHAMEDQTRFWGMLGLLVIVVIGVTVLSSWLSVSRATSDEAWTRLELAKTAAERVEIAKEYPNTEANRWALLQAANEYYEKGFADLPANREVALPDLKKALEQFELVAKDSPKESPQARAAAFGAARTLEARNELEKAIKRYEQVAETWPESEEGTEAARLAKALKSPETVQFYKELYAYKPAEVTLPPGGEGSFSLPPGHPPVGGSNPLEPFMLPPLPTAPGKAAAESQPLPSLPTDVFTPGNPAPKAEPPPPPPPPPPPTSAKDAAAKP